MNIRSHLRAPVAADDSVQFPGQGPASKRGKVRGAIKQGKSHKEGFLLDRRNFLRGGAAGLVVCFTMGVTSKLARAGTGTMVGAYIQIAPDAVSTSSNIVTVYIGISEMGQGIMTGLGQLVAEELMLPWSQVRTEAAPAAAAFANPLFGAQLTGGSTGMRGWFMPMRRAAAVAREMLVTAGAAALGQPRSACTANNGAVWCGTNSVPYYQIASAAAALTPPDPTTVPLVSSFKIIGQKLPRTDIPAKVTGAAKYGIDVRVPGMVYASVQHCPTIGGTVASMPAKPAGALALVNLGNAVAVVASDTWQAMKLAEGLNVSWTIPASSSAIDSAAILSTAQSLMVLGTPSVMEQSNPSDPTAPDVALSKAVRKVDATYQLPYLAHACMEVLSCTADVRSGSCEIWASTQGQDWCVATAKALLGLSASQITVHTMFLGGGLGRKIDQDYIAQAMLVAKAVGQPVKLTWSRKQDFKNDKYRPCALIRVQAGLDGSGNFSSLIYRNVSPSITAQRGWGPASSDSGTVEGATQLPYAILNSRIEYVQNPADVPLGWWRSVGNSYNVFAIESAVDELAGAIDPIVFRQKLLANDPRGQAVINAISSWNKNNALPSGRARGVAFSRGFGSYVALLAEISLDSTGNIRTNKVFCVIDCGTAVNPGLVEAQMQGGIVHGLSAALWGNATFTLGSSNLTNFNGYRMLRLSEMPVVTVQIINSGGSIGGIGETAVPCVAPAIANAYARLTTKRVRTLPFYPGATMGGL